MSKKKLRNILKKSFQSVTILIIPHNSRRPFNIKLPFFSIIILFIFVATGVISVFTNTVDKIEYRRMKQRLDAYSRDFKEIETTIEKLKENEKELKRLLAFNSKEEIIKNYTPQSDEIEFVELKKEINKTIESVENIKRYLAEQKNIYKAIPKGLPVSGVITSKFGKRVHPLEDREHFHNGIDVKARMGAPVKATADGFVSFSGPYGDYGNVIVIEHGLGFSTLYAHNSKNLVTVGQYVKRGDIIAYVGTTGNAQTPHTHYSVFKNGKPIDPLRVFKGN